MKYQIAIAALTACCLTAASALGQRDNLDLRFEAEGDAIFWSQQNSRPTSHGDDYNPEAAVAAGIKPSPPVSPQRMSPSTIAHVTGGEETAEWVYQGALNRYNQKLDRYYNALARWARQEEEQELQRIPDAPLEVKAQLYSQKLESLLGMPPVELGEDLNARRDELNKRIAEVSDPETAARAQIIVDKLGPLEAQAKAKAQASAAETTPTPPTPEPQMIALAQPVIIQAPYGSTTLEAGTHVEFVARENSDVRIRYAGQEFFVPSSAVDLK